uniref:Uncharacterized protein n=1 Tax=Triticum urartu TaxID=4572 RepID=A0A8R7TUX2_TRIUA
TTHIQAYSALALYPTPSRRPPPSRPLPASRDAGRRPPRSLLCSWPPASPLRPRPARRSAPALPPPPAATLPCPGRLAPLQAGGAAQSALRHSARPDLRSSHA